MDLMIFNIVCSLVNKGTTFSYRKYQISVDVLHGVSQACAKYLRNLFYQNNTKALLSLVAEYIANLLSSMILVKKTLF